MNTDVKANKLLLDLQQLTGLDEDAGEQLVLGKMLDQHTITPGIIQSFDISDQTAEVQPALRRLLLPDGKLVELPSCVKVPCYFPGGVLTFEIKKGMDCVLAVAERAIDAWWKSGGVQNPTELRFFDLSDSFAYVGFSSLPQALSDLHATATELRTRSGGNRISVRQDGTIHLGTSASLSTLVPPVNGVCLASGIEPVTGLPGFMLGWSSMSVMGKP